MCTYYIDNISLNIISIIIKNNLLILQMYMQSACIFFPIYIHFFSFAKKEKIIFTNTYR